MGSAYLSRGAVWRAPAWLTALVSLVFATTLLSAPPAFAASVTVSGTVACNNGSAVVGVWVRSSAGGAKFASFTKRAGAGWVADYTATLSTSSTTSTVGLNIGCGGTTSKWGSSNNTAASKGTGNRTLNAWCTPPTTAGASKACPYWRSKSVPVGLPFGGRWNKAGATLGLSKENGGNGHHAPAGGDWAVDHYIENKDAAFPSVYPQIWNAKSDKVTMKVMNTWNSCEGTGRSVRIGLYRGTSTSPFAWMSFSHLDQMPAFTNGQSVTNATFLGKIRQWPEKSSKCWTVTTKESTHTHLEFYNAEGLNQGWPCIGPLKNNTVYVKGRWLGSLGPNGMASTVGKCAV